jgi:hypothetical protein
MAIGIHPGKVGQDFWFVIFPGQPRCPHIWMVMSAHITQGRCILPLIK